MWELTGARGLRCAVGEELADRRPRPLDRFDRVTALRERRGIQHHCADVLGEPPHNLEQDARRRAVRHEVPTLDPEGLAEILHVRRVLLQVVLGKVDAV